MSVLKPIDIAVSSEGELVALKIGSSVMKMNYEDALKLSQWLRIRAKEAKKRAGDMSRHWSAIGTLDDPERTRG